MSRRSFTTNPAPVNQVSQTSAANRYRHGGLYTTSTNPVRITPLAPLSAADLGAIKDGAYGLFDNALVIRNGDALEPTNLGKSVESRIRLLLTVRDAVREVLRTQLENASEEQILRARRQLHLEYDRFFYRFGPISSKENFRAFAGDPDHPLLLSLDATDDQAETDRYWNAIVGNGGQESACGWCKDRWGVSWQITPRVLTEAMAAGGGEAKRAFEAMMSMKKIDVAAIQAARRG